MKLPRGLVLTLAPILGRAYLRLVGWTCRFEVINQQALDEASAGGRPVIFAFWHSRLALLAPMRRERPIYVMISRHSDGEIIARIAAAFNKPAVRGSTTRGGSGALRLLAEKVEAGQDAGVTPDGPRGPREVCQKGVVALAKMTGAPIVPVSAAAARCKRFNSWDRFVFPWPFNRIVAMVGEPVKVPGDATGEQLEILRSRVESILKELTEQAEKYISKTKP